MIELWILSHSIFMIKICFMQGFACIKTLSIQEVWRVQKILKRCSRYYYKQKKPLQHSSNSWRASHQDEKQLTHKPTFYNIFKVEVKILFERKLHLLCSSAYNSSTCTVAYETYDKIVNFVSFNTNNYCRVCVILIIESRCLQSSRY